MCFVHVRTHLCDNDSLNLAQPLHENQEMSTMDALEFLKVAADDDIDTFLAQLLRDSDEESKSLRHGRSLAQSTASIERGRERRVDQLFKNYFFNATIYSEHMFRRWHRISKQIFFIFSDAVLSVDSYTQQPEDCTGTKGLTTLQNITAAMRMLAYGCSADSLDETMRIAESTALGCLYRCSSAFVQPFKEKFERAPSDEKTKKLLQTADHLGFPETLGFVDCCKWR